MITYSPSGAPGASVAHFAPRNYRDFRAPKGSRAELIISVHLFFEILLLKDDAASSQLWSYFPESTRSSQAPATPRAGLSVDCCPRLCPAVWSFLQGVGAMSPGVATRYARMRAPVTPGITRRVAAGRCRALRRLGVPERMLRYVPTRRGPWFVAARAMMHRALSQYGPAPIPMSKRNLQRYGFVMPSGLAASR